MVEFTKLKQQKIIIAIHRERRFTSPNKMQHTNENNFAEIFKI